MIKEEIVDVWNKPEKEDNPFNKEPSKKDIDNTIKIDIPIKKEEVNDANHFKNIIIKKVNIIESMPVKHRAKSIDMKALKLFIKQPKVIKSLTNSTIKNLINTIIS